MLFKTHHDSFFIVVDCGRPGTPVNGHLGDFYNTIEGTNITFQCNEGYTPSAVEATTCTASALWEPNPANHICILVEGKVNEILMITGMLFFFTQQLLF